MWVLHQTTSIVDFDIKTVSEKKNVLITDSEKMISGH